MMLSIIKKSKEHLKKAEQGYFEHGVFAFRYGGKILIIGIISIIHGIIPGWFPFYVPKRIMAIINTMIERNVPGEIEDKIWQTILKESFWDKLTDYNLKNKNNSRINCVKPHNHNIISGNLKKHLIGKEYFKHGASAIKQGLYILVTGMVSIIHGIIPGWFPFYVPKRIIVIVNMIKSTVPEEGD